MYLKFRKCGKRQYRSVEIMNVGKIKMEDPYLLKN